MTAALRIYSIPSGMPFAKALAAEILKESGDAPEKLADYRILLPTRRACRTLRETFLQLKGGAPMLLPRLQPLGDVDEEELSLTLAGLNKDQDNWLEIPPALSAPHRQILLARTILKVQPLTQGWTHAFNLAQALGRLMDQIYTENLDMKNLSMLAPEEFSQHWQITLRFLDILSAHWPDVLKSYGVIDAADRRNRLIHALSNHWKTHPPAFPVIAAGSTGSIPATAELLKVIAGLPRGMVVLPGLESDMDEESWEVLDETHPQFGFKKLLQVFGIERQQVSRWPGIENPAADARRVLAAETMRPAATTDVWMDLSRDTSKIESFKNALHNLRIIDADHEQEEAQIIALHMRETLEVPGKTAALVTPDRALARRVSAICSRWDINIDDSGGQTLNKTPVAVFLNLLARAVSEQFSPTILLALLKQPICRAGLEDQIYSKAIQDLDKELRGPKPNAGLSGLMKKLEKSKTPENVTLLLRALLPILKPLEELSRTSQNFVTLLNAHIEAAEALARAGENAEESNLWAGEDGEAVAKAISEILACAEDIPNLDFLSYTSTLEQLLSGGTFRPAYGTHPRLMIFGQLEARLIDADLIILGGLNEGSWPPDPAHDSWMSRPMRKTFGLPAPERSIGLSSHDFVQGFCAKNVLITRAQRHGGAPAIPARWLQRLETVLQAANLQSSLDRGESFLSIARQMDLEDAVKPCPRPAPTPPVETRPRKMSVTRVEEWMKDPYSTYARFILALKKLDPLEQPLDARIRGTVIHSILERFTTAYPEALPVNAKDRLYQIADEELRTLYPDPAAWSFWWPRFDRFADEYLSFEDTWRLKHRISATEITGEIIIKAQSGHFTLTGKADRIDFNAGGAVIIDYKSGGSFSQRALEDGRLPQLPLEALILKHGGFQGIGADTVESLYYWKIGGTRKALTSLRIDKNLTQIIQRAEKALNELIDAYNKPETPYTCIPRPRYAPRFNDYEHLARVREWGIAADEEDIEEAA